MLVVHAVIPINPEKREEALELAETLVEKSNQEDGILDYRMALDIQDSNVLRVFEQYEDAEAFESHIGSEHFQEFESRLPELLGDEPEITRFEVDSATELDL